MIKKITIPIYDCTLFVCLGKTVGENRKKLVNVFGECDEDYYNCAGLCCHQGSNFGLFFEIKNLTIDTISHEIFHVTHRILERHETHFDSGHHEHAAALHGYLTDLVFKTLKLRIVNGNKHKNLKS